MLNFVVVVAVIKFLPRGVAQTVRSIVHAALSNENPDGGAGDPPPPARPTSLPKRLVCMHGGGSISYLSAPYVSFLLAGLVSSESKFT